MWTTALTQNVKAWISCGLKLLHNAPINNAAVLPIALNSDPILMYGHRLVQQDCEPQGVCPLQPGFTRNKLKDCPLFNLAEESQILDEQTFSWGLHMREGLFMETVLSLPLQHSPPFISVPPLYMHAIGWNCNPSICTQLSSFLCVQQNYKIFNILHIAYVSAGEALGPVE